MLQGMHQPAQSQPSPSSSSFAGLLASFASPRQPEDSAPPPSWTDSDLGEDVATISYESALRAHARYRPANPGEWLGMPDANSQANEAKDPATDGTAGSDKPAVDNASRTGQDGGLRRASVTVRLSRADLDRLRQRAGEAGLTVSAYLRSCTFEVETLRSQVKEALTQLRGETGNQGTREQGIGTTGGKETRQRAGEKEMRHGTIGLGLGVIFGSISKLWRSALPRKSY
jgi:hypothetical protein